MSLKIITAMSQKLAYQFENNLISRLFNKVPIFAKFFVSFFILNSIILGIGYVSTVEISNTSKYIEDVYAKPLQSVSFTKSALLNFNKLEFQIFKATQHQNLTEENLEEINELVDSFKNDLDVVTERAIGEYSQETIAELQAQISEWEGLKDRIFAPNMDKGLIISQLRLISENIEINLLDLAEFEIGAAYDFVIDANDKSASIKEQNIIISITAALLCLIIATILTFNVINPIKQCLKVAANISKGDLNNQITSTRRDEFGKLLARLKKMQQNLIQNIEEQKVSIHKSQAKEQADKQVLLDNISSSLETKFQDGFKVVKNALHSLDDTSETLTSNAQSSAKQIEHTVENMNELDVNMANISSATDELSTAIANINAKTLDSDEIASQTVTKANNATKAIENLKNTSDQVGTVLESIEEITNKINLLALNATIEAARAGEAGKGFAIVASEVKGLSTQTANATSQIQTQISKMQKASDHVSISVEEIATSIAKTQEISSDITDLIKHQNDATAEIVEMVQNVSSTTENTSKSVKSVSSSLSGTNNSSDEVRSAATSLSQQMDALQKAVSQSISAIKTA